MPSGWRARYLRYQEFFLNVIAVYRRRQDLMMFLEIILSMATIAFFSFFALRPTALTIAQLLTDVRTKDQVVSKMDQKIQNLISAHTVFNAEGASIPIIDFSVPSTPSPDSFVRQIEGLAASHSAKVLGISIGEITLVGEEKVKHQETSPLPEDAKGVPFSVSITGDYPLLVSFLSDLENMRRPIKIDSAGISSSEKEGLKILILVISGRTPYLGSTK